MESLLKSSVRRSNYKEKSEYYPKDMDDFDYNQIKKKWYWANLAYIFWLT